jgi:hypothetical protein
MNLVKDINGETDIKSIYSEINDYLSVIEAWLSTITQYKYIF